MLCGEITGIWCYIHDIVHVHVLMRDEKEGRKEGKSKKVKQTIRQSNTAHPMYIFATTIQYHRLIGKHHDPQKVV